MALTDDQKAMLRLLAQREEGYEDMAALMGISVEEVRERVKEALAEVEEPIGTESAPQPSVQPQAAPPPQEPEPPAPEPEPTPPPREPEAPAPPPATKPGPSSGRPAGARLPRLTMPKDRGALIGLGAGALVVIAFVVVLLLSGGDDGSSSTATSGEGVSAASAPTAAESEKLTQAILSPVDGGEGSGRALFGRFEKKVLLQVTAEGLDPSQSGESYAVWLSHSGRAMVPVGTAKANDSGEIATRFEVPATVLVLVARSVFDEIEVTRTTDRTLAAALVTARRTQKESAYTGTPVLSGRITGPLLQAGKGASG